MNTTISFVSLRVNSTLKVVRKLQLQALKKKEPGFETLKKSEIKKDVARTLVPDLITGIPLRTALHVLGLGRKSLVFALSLLRCICTLGLAEECGSKLARNTLSLFVQIGEVAYAPYEYCLELSSLFMLLVHPERALRMLYGIASFHVNCDAICFELHNEDAISFDPDDYEKELYNQTKDQIPNSKNVTNAVRLCGELRLQTEKEAKQKADEKFQVNMQELLTKTKNFEKYKKNY